MEPTLRDMFALNAPAEPTFEFEVVMPNNRSDCPYSEQAEWDREYSRQKAIQWPYAYAEEQMTQRGDRISTVSATAVIREAAARTKSAYGSSPRIESAVEYLVTEAEAILAEGQELADV